MLSTKEELYLYLEKISRGYALKDLEIFYGEPYQRITEYFPVIWPVSI